ncbi:MAG: efflux RND transporter periplasmic adaptor subunit [Alphaproteobacteria bacterium]|nr:efflux RND transporter periplasmic adaptor subunit [Alphaproteobacteria bacterium]
MKFNTLLLVLLILGLMGGAGFWWWRQPVTVAVVQPHRGPAVQGVYATGTVEPSVMVPIAARAAGHMVELLADEGAAAGKDQVLARLEAPDLQASLSEAKAREDYARQAFTRMAILFRGKVVSKDEYDKARTDLDAATAARVASEAALSYTELKAPAEGLIIRRDGEIGEFIAAGQAVFWMSCCAPLRITTEVDEEDIPQIKVGQPVLIRADAYPGQIFHGTVQSITPKGDPVARSYRMRVGFDDPQVPLMIGMTAETNVILRKTENALLVPSAALGKDEEGGSFLWSVDQDKLRKIPVTLGARGAKDTEIVAGLSDQDLVVRTLQEEFEEGQKVHVQKSR